MKPQYHNLKEIPATERNRWNDRYECLDCGRSWQKPPQSDCPKVKAYDDWRSIPRNLKTKNVWREYGRNVVKGAKRVAVMVSGDSCDYWALYDYADTVAMKRTRTVKKNYEVGE